MSQHVWHEKDTNSYLPRKGLDSKKFWCMSDRFEKRTLYNRQAIDEAVRFELVIKILVRTCAKSSCMLHGLISLTAILDKLKLKKTQQWRSDALETVLTSLKYAYEIFKWTCLFAIR